MDSNPLLLKNAFRSISMLMILILLSLENNNNGATGIHLNLFEQSGKAEIG